MDTRHCLDCLWNTEWFNEERKIDKCSDWSDQLFWMRTQLMLGATASPRAKTQGTGATGGRAAGNAKQRAAPAALDFGYADSGSAADAAGGTAGLRHDAVSVLLLPVHMPNWHLDSGSAGDAAGGTARLGCDQVGRFCRVLPLQ